MTKTVRAIPSTAVAVISRNSDPVTARVTGLRHHRFMRGSIYAVPLGRRQNWLLFDTRCRDLTAEEGALDRQLV